jgi:hypothetical protein
MGECAVQAVEGCILTAWWVQRFNRGRAQLVVDGETVRAEALRNDFHLQE